MLAESTMADNFYTGVKKIERSDIKTAAFDARFPNTDQTKNCWQNYVDFYKCIRLKVCVPLCHSMREREQEQARKGERKE